MCCVAFSLALSPSSLALTLIFQTSRSHKSNQTRTQQRREPFVYTSAITLHTHTYPNFQFLYECDSNFLWFGLLSRKTSRYNLFWVIKSPIHLYIYILGHCWTKSQKCTFLSSNPGIQRSCCSASAVFISHKRLIIFTPRKIYIYIYICVYTHITHPSLCFFDKFPKCLCVVDHIFDLPTKQQRNCLSFEFSRRQRSFCPSPFSYDTTRFQYTSDESSHI